MSVFTELTQEQKDQLENVFTYHPADEVSLPKYAAIRESAKAFAGVLIQSCPQSADRTAALRKVREAVMTANAAIALGGKSF
jgi:ribosomal protein L19